MRRRHQTFTTLAKTSQGVMLLLPDAARRMGGLCPVLLTPRRSPFCFQAPRAALARRNGPMRRPASRTGRRAEIGRGEERASPLAAPLPHLLPRSPTTSRAHGSLGGVVTRWALRRQARESACAPGGRRPGRTAPGGAPASRRTEASAGACTPHAAGQSSIAPGRRAGPSRRHPRAGDNRRRNQHGPKQIAKLSEHEHGIVSGLSSAPSVRAAILAGPRIETPRGCGDPDAPERCR